MIRRPHRTLTDEEVVLVHQWARRNHLALWLLVLILPAVVVYATVSLGGVEGIWLGAGTILLVTAVVAVFVAGTWRSMRAYRRVDSATPVETLRGVLRQRRIGKSYALAIDDLSVYFVNRDVRGAVKIGEPIVADVVMGAPVLVITAKPGSKRKGKASGRSSKRRRA